MADTGSCFCLLKIKVNHLKFCKFFSTRCHWRSNIRFKDFLNWTEFFSMRNFSRFLSLGYLLNPCIRNIRHHGGPLQSNIWSHQFSFFTHQSFLFPGILTIRGDSSVFDTDSLKTIFATWWNDCWGWCGETSVSKTVKRGGNYWQRQWSVWEISRLSFMCVQLIKRKAQFVICGPLK